MEIHDDDPPRQEYFDDNLSGTNPSVTNIPTKSDLNLKSNVNSTNNAELPSRIDPTSLPYPSDYTDEVTEGAPPGVAGSLINEDFFSSKMGTAKPNKEDNKPDPNKLQVSSKEINQQFKQGVHVDSYKDETKKTARAGDAGSSWRMMKLKRCYEHAEEEGKHVDELGVDRFGSIDAWRDAQEERRILDERDSKRFNRRESGGSSYRGSPRPNNSPRNMYTSPATSDYGSSRPSSRASFKRPSDTRTPTRSTQPPKQADRINDLKGESKPSTPTVPKVFTPTSSKPSVGRPKSPDSLNKLQAQIMKARLMNKPNLKDLEKEYEIEMEKSKQFIQTGGDVGHGLMNVDLRDKTGLEPVEDRQKTKIEVLPTLDGHGRLYDVGQGRKDESLPTGNKRKKIKNQESIDERTGEITRYNIDDDDQSLAELVRQERFAGGSADQKNYDAEFANAITTDHLYEHGDTDQVDDNAAKYARKKMKSDSQKRQFAIGDFKRTKRVLDSCRFCFGDDGDLPPRCGTIISSGTRVYLALPETEQLVNGHCIIVPIQHCLSTLEADDDVWEEIRNYMKCLMQAFASQNRGVVFYETVMSVKAQLHTVIEAVPVPVDIFEVLPGYFHESILSIESEWTQHKKLIDFSEREFRRALVPNLPYFAILWNYKGNAGFGHVIEGVDKANEEDDSEAKYMDNSQSFPKYFAAEVIGNVLELEPRLWRRPKKLHKQDKEKMVEKFKKFYLEFDWTKLLVRIGTQISRSVRRYASASSGRVQKPLPVFNKESDKVWMAASALVTIGGAIYLTSPGSEEHGHGHAVEHASEKAEETKEEVKEEASEAKEATEEKAEDVKEAAEEKVDDASEKASEKKEEVTEKAEEKVDDAKESVKETSEGAAEKAEEKTSEVAQKAEDKSEDVKENVKEGAETAKENVKEGAEEAKEKVEEKKEEVKEKTESDTTQYIFTFIIDLRLSIASLLTMSYLRIKRKRNQEPLDALLIEENESEGKKPQPRKKRQRQGLFRLAETVEQSTFTSTETKEELQARLKRKAEDDLEEDAERRHKQSLGRQIRPKPTTSRRYHVVTEDDDKKDVFIDVEQSKNESVNRSDKKDASFDPYDEDSEQMREFRKLVEDYLKMQETVTPESPTPETDKDDDYVFDVYYRDKADLRNNTQIMSNIGLLTGFYDEFGLNFDQDYSSDSTDIQDEADEDSNEEDYYTNDYPDEEVGSEEEEYPEEFVDDSD
ncbi:hypothetical protein E3Q22_04269 [Wallemia mellicola]|uniref:Cwf19-like C-terminal domain-containing protein n=2 Tax=Wallemia mellicola TaxID=1708541 RepID=A0A4T0T9J1_9BASI|nr:hypothetical protein E3Q22_04269 [Wallemia mellicola]TIC07230.1 hypothetical protein E3Q14_04321 [Wallemia mellicola]TIC48433.1 hypothetical protein E3Q05_04201 [Wallemia mellicola]TIC61732.1 hypothetical protein E3Q01_04257 [Wallemia mellicola]